jgi:hypothetical protein
MTHQDLNELTPTLMEAVSPDDLAKSLSMPVEEKINDLTINANQMAEDADHFAAFGIDWEAQQQKIIRAVNALRSAETLYTAAAESSAEAQEIWRNNRDDLYNWRAESMARLNFLARKTGNRDLLASLEKISGGDGHLDAIQDAHETLQLVQTHFDALADNNLTQERITQAEELVAAVSQAYPKVSAGASGDKSAKDLRDRAFWYCCHMEDELKDNLLPLIFFDNYARRQEYGSNYLRELAEKRSRSQN